MKKTVTKWTAWLHRPYNHNEKCIRTLKIEVVETPKQFRIIGDGPVYREATAACGYRHLVNKETNSVLFDSKREALLHLSKVFSERERRATKESADAQEDLCLVAEALLKPC